MSYEVGGCTCICKHHGETAVTSSGFGAAMASRKTVEPARLWECACCSSSHSDTGLLVAESRSAPPRLGMFRPAPLRPAPPARPPSDERGHALNPHGGIPGAADGSAQMLHVYLIAASIACHCPVSPVMGWSQWTCRG